VNRIKVGIIWERPSGERLAKELEVPDTAIWPSTAHEVLIQAREMNEEDLVIRVWKIEEDDDPQPA